MCDLNTVSDCILLYFHLFHNKVDSLCSTIKPVLTLTNTEQTCKDATGVAKLFIGYPAVYRICLGVACFFFLLMVIMINVQSSKDPRSKIQNGFVHDIILILIMS